MAKVLIVEDTEVNRLVLSSRMKNLGYEVIVAADGGEGVAKAKHESPDIILLDMCLPVMDGAEVTHSLKHCEHTKDIPIIAITAHSVTQGRDHTIEIGCDEYETKPVDFDRLAEKIEALIGN